MTLTITQLIETLSYYTVGESKDITDSELLIYRALVAGEVARLNPGFTGDELLKFEAYLILDLYENKPGTGPRSQEKIKDNQYTIKTPVSSSYWKDCALQMIADFLKYGKSAGNEFDGVERADHTMSEYSDGYPLPDYCSYDDLGET